MAMKMATDVMKDESTSQIFQGVGTLASTGAKAYDNYKADPSPATTSTSTEGMVYTGNIS
jgi:hypothetical protein